MAKPMAMAIAASMMADIRRVGPIYLANKVAMEVIKYIWHCGRIEYGQLRDTEKTHVGTIVEVAILRELGWVKNKKGKDTTLTINLYGVEHTQQIDLKFSASKKNKDRKGSMPYGWQISLECWGDICILVSFCPYTARFSLGILDCSVQGYLAPLPKKKKASAKRGGGPGRDLKRSVTVEGRNKILWIIHELQTIENIMPEKFKEFVSLFEQTDMELEGMILSHQRDEASRARASMRLFGRSRKQQKATPINHTLRKLV